MDTKIAEAVERFTALCDERSGTEDADVETLLDMERDQLRKVINSFADDSVATAAAYVVASGDNPLARLMAASMPVASLAKSLLTVIVELQESNKHLTQCFLTVLDSTVGGVERNEEGRYLIPVDLPPSDAAQSIIDHVNGVSLDRNPHLTVADL
jgi:hypothetical protein